MNEPRPAARPGPDARAPEAREAAANRATLPDGEAGRQRLLAQIDQATERLLGTAGSLTDAAVRQPSLLPGWTRGHVLNHLAHSAAAMINLLTWARTGQFTPAYPSQQARDDEIETGAARAAPALLADVTRSAAEFRVAAQAVPSDGWRTQVRVLDYSSFPAAQLLLRRLVEVELHHTDLGAGYAPADWPARFTTLDLPEPMQSQRRDRIEQAPPTTDRPAGHG
jgi:maleylpyruvate isomerase